MINTISHKLSEKFSFVDDSIKKKVIISAIELYIEISKDTPCNYAEVAYFKVLLEQFKQE